MDNEHSILKDGYELCHIISVALKEEQVSYVDNADRILQLASIHSLLMLVSSAMPNIDSKWISRNDVDIARTMSMDYEREELYEFLREHHLWYMPMKGLVLRELYPETMYREMCDSDIMYDERGYHDVKRWFMERGYETKYNAEHVHVDEYIKKPFFNFEMHKRFFSFEHKEWAEYYSDIGRFLRPVDEYERRFSDEDFYVYIVLHAYKHYSDCGTGLRSLVDIYLYVTKKELDWKYVQGELDKLGIAEFEHDVRTLSRKLFDGGDLGADEEEMFLYILSSGTYGTKEHYLEKQLQNQSKLKYMLKRAFPSREWVQNVVPFYKKHPGLIPCYYIYRIVNRAVRHPENIRNEVVGVRNIKG
jgi:hypothetical protein